MRNNLTLGVCFISVGVALIVTLDPWFPGLAFLLVGGHRLFVAVQEGYNDERG